MQGITSLEGHGEANSRMRNSLRMVVPQLSPEQKEKIMQDIMQTVSPQPEPAMPDNINIGDQQFDMSQLDQMPMEMPMQAAEDLADMGQGGDTKLAHMDPETIAMAQAMGILPKAKQNVMTGLPAFSATGGGDSGADETGGGTGSGDVDGQPDEIDDRDRDYFGGPIGDLGPVEADIGIDMPTQAAQNTVGVESPLDFSKEYEGLRETLSPGQFNQAKDFGLMSSIATMQALSRAEDKDKAIDAVVDARLSHDPSMSQLDLNNALDRGFRMENPMMAGLMSGISMVGGFMPGPVGAVFSAGNLANKMSGSGNTLAGLSGIPTADPSKSAGLQANLDSIMDQAAKDESGIQGSRDMDIAGGGAVDFMDFEPEPVEEDPVVDPVEGVNSGLNMLISEGYSEDVGQTIIDNFRTVEAFKQSYRNRFNQEPTPVSLAEPSKRAFINIGRGQVQGMT